MTLFTRSVLDPPTFKFCRPTPATIVRMALESFAEGISCSRSFLSEVPARALVVSTTEESAVTVIDSLMLASCIVTSSVVVTRTPIDTLFRMTVPKPGSSNVTL